MTNSSARVGQIDAPMPLETAAQAFFPHGGATKSTLLAACRKGALAYAKVGNRYLVTQADMTGWIDKCRAKPNQPEPTFAAVPEGQPNSLYSTMDESLKLDLENAVIGRLRKRSHNTLPETSRLTRKSVTKPRLRVVK